MAQISFDDKEFQNSINRLSKTVSQSEKSTLEVLASHILGDAEPFTPMDEGYLKDSASVDADYFGGVALGYNIRYAARMHENPQYRFKKHRHPNAKGKWLESTIKNNLDAYNEYLGKVLQVVIEVGTEGNGNDSRASKRNSSTPPPTKVEVKDLISSGKVKVTKSNFDFDKARETAIKESRKEERKSRTY